MRLVLDLQPLQTGSRPGGIGRYALNHARKIIGQNDGDEIFLLVNDSNPGSYEYVTGEFADLVPAGDIRVCPFPASFFDRHESWVEGNEHGHVRALELLREAFISRMRPDFVLVYSHMEFYEMASSLKAYTDVPVGVVVYDFIPYHDGNFSGRPLSARYSEKLEGLKRADLLFGISDYVCRDAKEVLKRDGGIFPVGTGKSDFWKKVPFSDGEHMSFLKRHGIPGPFIMYSGGLDERKNVKRLVEAYSSLDEGIRGEYSLFVVCGDHRDEQEDLEKYASSLNIGVGNVLFAGYVSDEDLRAAYNLCSLFVFPSLSEDFGLPPLEAMSCGAPTIASNRTSLPEVMGMEGALFDPESVDGIRAKMERALTDQAFCGDLKARSSEQAGKFSWRKTAKRTMDRIREFLGGVERRPTEPLSEDDCMRKMAALLKGCRGSGRFAGDPKAFDSFVGEVSQCVADIYSERPCKRRIFLELSVLDRVDGGTGIQRVSKNVLKHIKEPASDFEVIPVRGLRDSAGYEKCRKFCDCPCIEPLVSPIQGDLFFFPELAPDVVLRQRRHLMRLRERGVRVVSTVFDLIPVRMPDFCKDQTSSIFPWYLDAVAGFDGAVCDSRAVADELERWIGENRPERSGSFRIDWFHLGADFGGGDKSSGLPADASKVLGEMRAKTSFLMVSTIEPRKRYDQALDAFEILWGEGFDACLVFVGREGWKVESLVERIRSHPELGVRLFWLSGISDEYLDRLYDSADCVLMTSMAEGFGLAIAEAAYHKRPVVLRDIPVFREIAGDCAFYFSGNDGGSLARALKEWAALYKSGSHPKTDSLRFLTWRESVSSLFEKLKKYM